MTARTGKQIVIRLYGEQYREFQKWAKLANKKDGTLVRIIVDHFLSVSDEEKAKIVKYALEKELQSLYKKLGR